MAATEQLKFELLGDSSSLENAGKRGSAALNSIKKPAGDASQSLVNLSRVAQDAPYGFIGIANNLNPLLESFQRLSKETGGTKNALASLGGALTGPEGIGLALGVVSSLLVAFGGKLFGATSDAEKLDTAIKKMNDTFNAMEKSIDRVKSSLDFSTKLEQLNIQIANFGKIGGGNVESINAQIDANKKLIDEIKKKRDIFKETSKFAFGTAGGGDLDPSLTGAAEKFAQTMQKIRDKTLKNEAGDLVGKFGHIKLDPRLTAEIKSKVIKFNEQITEIERNNAILQKQITLDTLENQRTANEKASQEDSKKISKLKAAIKAEEDLRLRHEKYMKSIDTSFALPSGSELGDVLYKISQPINVKTRVNIVPDSVTFNPNEALDFVKKQQDAELLANTISGSLTPAFQDMFSAILAGENPLKAFFKSLAQEIQRLISQLIAAAIRALVLKILIPGAAGAGGGGLLRAAAGGSSLGGFAQGGVVPPGYANDSYPALLTSGEVVTPQKNWNQLINAVNMGGTGGGGTIVHEISGDTLRLWLERANTNKGLFG